jgi:hypothetical protein
MDDDSNIMVAGLEFQEPDDEWIHRKNLFNLDVGLLPPSSAPTSPFMTPSPEKHDEHSLTPRILFAEVAGSDSEEDIKMVSFMGRNYLCSLTVVQNTDPLLPSSSPSMVSSPMLGPTLLGDETDPDSKLDRLAVMSSPGPPCLRDQDHMSLIPSSTPLLRKRTGSHVNEQVGFLRGFI